MMTFVIYFVLLAVCVGIATSLFYGLKAIKLT